MKYILSVVLLFFSFSIIAQTNIQVGGGLGFGSEISTLAIDLRGSANITEDIDGAVSINIFLPDKEDVGGFESKFSMWTINFDGHYLFTNTETSKLYGLGGLNITSWSSESEFDNFFTGGTETIDVSDTDIGLNIGGGAEFPFSGNLTGFGEVKYVISDLDQLVIVAGVLFNVGG